MVVINIDSLCPGFILTNVEDEITIEIRSRLNEIKLTKSRIELQSYYSALLEEIRNLELKRKEEEVEEVIMIYDSLLDLVGHMLLVVGVE